MRSRLIITVIYCIVLTLSGCTNEESESIDLYKQRLVVDGRIENGRNAVVMLTINHPYDTTVNTEQLQDMVVRWAKVTVSNSHQSEVLTGRYDERYPTNFVYTGRDIIGEEGETYTLRIDYSNQTWMATTTIPKATTLENITTESFSLLNFTINATVLPSEDNSPYMIECSSDEKSAYLAPCLMGIFDGTDTSRDVSILPPLNIILDQSYTPSFPKTDTVILRVSTMSNTSYDYWIHWENNLINTLNPLFPPQSNPPTNISNGALGIWAGYGCSYYRVCYDKEAVDMNKSEQAE